MDVATHERHGARCQIRPRFMAITRVAAWTWSRIRPNVQKGVWKRAAVALSHIIGPEINGRVRPYTRHSLTVPEHPNGLCPRRSAARVTPLLQWANRTPDVNNIRWTSEKVL